MTRLRKLPATPFEVTNGNKVAYQNPSAGKSSARSRQRRLVMIDKISYRLNQRGKDGIDYEEARRVVATRIELRIE